MSDLVDPERLKWLEGIGLGFVAAKLLGPTLDHYGARLREYISGPGEENFVRVCQAAVRKLGARIEEPGAIPPRVVRELIDASVWCENELWAEYLGGLLACSRSGVARDDRTLYLIQITKRLSVYQIRTHYIIYRIARELLTYPP